MHGRILPRSACNSCGFTMKMSSRYHRLLIYDVKRTTKIDGMGPFDIKSLVASVHNLTVLLIFFNSILFIFWFLQFSGSGIHSKKMLSDEHSVLLMVVHVICILQAFNCLYREIFVHDIHFCLFNVKPNPME